MEHADWLDDWLAEEIKTTGQADQEAELEHADWLDERSDTAGQEAGMERADWLNEGFDSAQARFLLVTAITHHRFNSPIWGEHEVRKLHAELAEIDSAALQATSAYRMRRRFL